MDFYVAFMEIPVLLSLLLTGQGRENVWKILIDVMRRDDAVHVQSKYMQGSAIFKRFDPLELILAQTQDLAWVSVLAVLHLTYLIE